MPSHNSNEHFTALAALVCALLAAGIRPAYAEEQATAGADVISTDAYDALIRDLLLRIDLIEMEVGRLSVELLTPLFELGKVYVSGDRCRNAIPILQRAILLSQRLEGLMSPHQLPLYEPLLECFVALDMIRDLQRAQDQMVLVNESTYGKEDVRMLPALAHAARWYEQSGLYDNARQLYSRAMKIVRKTGGEQDERLVDPLRGMAQTFRLEAQYAESMRSSALNAAGERTLERAAMIVRANPDADSKRRIETLLELADWYQMSGAIRDAMKAYKEVWAVADAGEGSASAVLGDPEPILYRAQIGVALRRPPADREKLQHYFVAFDFTVTRRGEVTDVVVTDATAPKDLQLSLAENLKRTHYRPRFVEGEPVDTRNIQLRQGVWVGQ